MPVRDLNHNPRSTPRSVPGSSDPGFVDSSGDSSGSHSDHPIKDSHQVPIIKIPSVPSENSTKDTSHVSKELLSNKPRNIMIEYSSVNQTGSPTTIPTDNSSSNSIA